MTASSERPKIDGQLRIDLLVDSVCEQFERDWKAGQRPRIEDFLARVEPSVQHTALRELIALERELSNGAADISDYRRRFAEYPSAVDAGWALVQRSPGRSVAEPTATFSRDTGAHALPVQSSEPTAEAVPEKIGRYAIREVLGRGGFAVVYLAHDTQLDRAVALKVPRRERFGSPQELDRFVEEARHAAQLDHPAIVRVHDVQREADSLYIVQQYVAGQDLAKRASTQRLTPQQVVSLITRVAEAIGYAHQRGLVHRDLKPANILMDAAGNPHVVDFGLAVHADEQHNRRGELAGTYPYMSPEQIRGEVHRLDGRSDIWSLGVILYELLTGCRPFNASDREALGDEIQHRDPRPPRQLDPAVPPELSRICLACLMKRATDRYASAADLTEDLRHWQEARVDKSATQASGIQSTDISSPNLPKIVPKGLRSYDGSDADFFLELLPGARDRNGLPKSIRFWKNRIECIDPDESFSVGVMYGPSGCGKSSLVKAGLLPRLAPHVLPVLIEATAEDTEVRLLKGLRKYVPELPADLDLPQTLRWLRDHPAAHGRKILIVLDQFEQWLHAHGDDEAPQLIASLRHCDGVRVQCIVMARDDFWLAVSRFMRDVEVPLVEGHNSALVDVFDIQHANKVLVALGRAFQCLPEGAAELTADQAEFVNRSIAGLAESGKVICVRLALFAEMMKGRLWTPATLREVGGTEGVGVTFLEETFSAATAPPEHRFHQKAARAVLKALLPESGSDIKGHMRPQAELLEKSGYATRPQDFTDLLRILDREIRLITPTDPEGKEVAEESTSAAQPGQRYCQLTHDYLVPSLRDWLTRKQKETRRGRAELRLAERSATWNAKPDRRFLPSLWEYLSIVGLTPRKNWTGPQRKMMRQAGRFHGLWAAGILLLLAIATATGLSILKQQNLTRAELLVDALVNADIGQVPAAVRDLAEFRVWADPLLKREFAKANAGSREKLYLAVALLPVDETQVSYLRDQLPVVSPGQFPVVRDVLLPHQKQLIEPLWKVALDEQQPIQPRFQAACALATYAPEDPRWGEVDAVVAVHLVTRQASDLVAWREALRPAKNQLLKSLGHIYRDIDQERQYRVFATETLADYAADQQAVLMDLLTDAERFQYLVIFARLDAAKAIPLAAAELTKQPTSDASEDDKEQLAERQANAAVALVRLGAAEQAWPLLKHTPDPRARTYFIHWLSPLGADPRAIIQRLEVEPVVSIRRALLLALGEFDETQLPPAERLPIVEKLVALYETEPDAGLHAVVEWLLRRWGEEQQFQAVVERLKANQGQRSGPHAGEKRNWYVNSQGQTMVILEAGEFLMGSPTSEPDRTETLETLHRRKIGRRFAIATHEVTKAQFGTFQAERPEIAKLNTHPFVQTVDSPQVAMTWYEAAAYCNWLSLKDGLGEDEWCYEPNTEKQFAAGMKTKPQSGELLGYRLPSEAEWEYACRAGAVTSRYYGSSEPLLPKYAWYLDNSQRRTWPAGSLKPNDFGLFDMLGNVMEWTDDLFRTYPDPSLGALDPVAGYLDSRVFRGSSYDGSAQATRSANRNGANPAYGGYFGGFRAARNYP